MNEREERCEKGEIGGAKRREGGAMRKWEKKREERETEIHRLRIKQKWYPK